MAWTEYKLHWAIQTFHRAPHFNTYTVVWDESVSNPAQMFVRYEDDAVNMTQWSSAWDTIFWYSAVRLNGSGVETDEVTQSSPWVLDISWLWTLTSGDNIMIKFPIMWIKMEKNWTQVKLSLTEELNKTWFQYYAFQKWTISNPTVTKPAFYLWVYKWYVDENNKLLSLSGKTPTDGSVTLDNFMLYAQNNWTWFDIAWFYQQEYINALYMLKYWNPSSKTQVGYWYGNESWKATTWWTNSQTNATYGTTSNFTTQVKLFWLEDWWWNLHEWMWWCNICSTEFTVQLPPFNTNVYTYSFTGIMLNSFQSWAYISSISWTNNGMFMPVAVDSNYGTLYYQDYWNITENMGCPFIARWWAYDWAQKNWAFAMDAWDWAGMANNQMWARLMYL